MKFLKRSHYCPYCQKQVFFPEFTTTKTVQEEKICKRCGNKTISFWETINPKYIIMIVIGTQFFVAAVLYSLWKLSLHQRSSFDVFIVVFDVIISGLILLFSSMFKSKISPPLASNYSTDPELKLFRLQFLYIIALMLVGYLLAAVLDLTIWALWQLG